VANLSQVHAGKGTGVLPPPDKTWLLERNAFRPIVWLDSWPENHHVCHIFHIGKNDGKTMVMVFGKDLIHQNQYKPSSCDVFFSKQVLFHLFHIFCLGSVSSNQNTKNGGWQDTFGTDGTVVHHDFFGRISPLTEPSRDGTMVAVDGRWFPGIHGLDSSQEYPLHRFLTLVPGWGMGSRKNTPW
jgi:hypothetical protein